MTPASVAGGTAPLNGTLPGVSWTVLIMAAALAVRLYVAANTAVVNLDGCLYIHQARALVYGPSEALRACDASRLNGYVSALPMMIAGVHWLVPDWIVAARIVALLFGTLTVAAAYLLARRFFDPPTSRLVMLTFALTPFMVQWSVDVLRGPPAWFFALAGLYALTGALPRGNPAGTAGGAACLVLAAACRVEFALFIVVATLVLLRGTASGRMPLAAFLMPVGIACVVLLPGIRPEFQGRTPLQWIQSAWEHQRLFRAQLSDWQLQLPEGPLPGFIDAALDMAWLVALGTALHTGMETFWYPFFAVALLGLPGFRRRWRRDPRWRLLGLQAVTAAIALFAWTAVTWINVRRYWVLVLVAAVPLLGGGWQRLQVILATRTILRPRTIQALACVLIAAVSLPKNIGPREADKAVFKEIGQFIARHADGPEEIRIAAASLSAALSWAIFYANLEVAGAPCPRPDPALLGPVREVLAGTGRATGCDYYLWEQGRRPAPAAGSDPLADVPGVIRLREWRHPDSGRIIVYAVGGDGRS